MVHELYDFFIHDTKVGGAAGEWSDRKLVQATPFN